MQIKFADIVKPITFEFMGQEEWLANVRKSFPLGLKSPLRGSMEIRPMGSGRFELKGRIQVEPMVPCSRCNDSISWAVDEKIHVTVQREGNSDREDWSDLELGADDLEIYEVPGDSINLETILNDAIQLAIPYRCVQVDEMKDGIEKCRVCGDNLNDSLVTH